MGSIIEWSLVVLFGVLAVVLFSGKGAFLIAGYNTASKAERAMYDEKKLCRVMGSGMGAIAVLMAIVGCFGYDKPTWVIGLMPVGIIVIVVVMLILCNTICKAKNPPEGYYEEDAEASTPNKKIVIGVVIFTVVVLLSFMSTLFTGDIKTTINGTEININGSYWEDYAVSIDSIKEVSLKEGINLGKRTNGMGSVKLSEGSFKNDEFGSYTLYAYNNCKSYILINTTDGMVVINGETTESTKVLYEKIVVAINSR